MNLTVNAGMSLMKALFMVVIFWNTALETCKITRVWRNYFLEKNIYNDARGFILGYLNTRMIVKLSVSGGVNKGWRFENKFVEYKSVV